jgi:two-component system LytT family response regulator
MSHLRVAIVDDEAPARALLREYLAAEPCVEVVAECANGFEAVRAVEELHPDVLLLDVQMPKLSGFDVLELVERDVAVIFVTAYDAYAVRAFEVQAVDYLLKPVAPERLRQALARARQRLGRPHRAASAALQAATGSQAEVTRLIVRDGGQVEILPLEAIDVIEAQDDCVVVRAKGRRLRKTSTLSELAAQLDPGRFVRVHRCFLLNVTRLTRIELYARDSRLAVLADGSKIPVSRSGYARLRAVLPASQA